MSDKPDSLNDVEKLRKHAHNVRVAANLCNGQVDVISTAFPDDDSDVTKASKDDLIAKEKVKQRCLNEAADFMEYIADDVLNG